MKIYWPFTLTISYALVTANLFVSYQAGMHYATVVPYLMFVISLFISIPSYGLNPVKRCMALYLLIALNDTGYKLFSRGDHTMVLNASLTLLYISCSVLVYIPFIIFTFIRSSNTRSQKIICLFLLPALLILHELIFLKLGIGKRVNLY